MQNGGSPFALLATPPLAQDLPIPDSMCKCALLAETTTDNGRGHRRPIQARNGDRWTDAGREQRKDAAEAYRRGI